MIFWLHGGQIVQLHYEIMVEFFHHDVKNVSTLLKKVSTRWKFPPLKKTVVVTVLIGLDVLYDIRVQSVETQDLTMFCHFSTLVSFSLNYKNPWDSMLCESQPEICWELYWDSILVSMCRKNQKITSALLSLRLKLNSLCSFDRVFKFLPTLGFSRV